MQNSLDQEERAPQWMPLLNGVSCISKPSYIRVSTYNISYYENDRNFYILDIMVTYI